MVIMNLAKQIREFGIRNSINPMSRDVQTLYYNLIQLFNVAYWQPRLQVETKTLEHLCDMSRKQIDIARNVLIQKGFIQYYKKTGSASPDYELIRLYEESVFPGETQTGVQMGSQIGEQTEHKRNTTETAPYIDKTIKTKLNSSLLFRESEFFDFEKFSSALPDWSSEKTQHYYHAALDWSDANNEKKANWIATVRSWDRKEPFESRIKKNNTGARAAPNGHSPPDKHKEMQGDLLNAAKELIEEHRNGESTGIRWDKF
jgi:hypothetical protein